MKIVHGLATGLYAIGYLASGLWFLWIFLSESYRQGLWSLINPFFDLQLTFIWLLSWETWALLAYTVVFYTIAQKTAPKTDAAQAN